MRGIDIYSGTIITDWSAIKGTGVEAVYIKATEGLTYVNPLMDSQYKNAKNQGLKVGFYHFAAKNNPVGEYRHFIDTIGNYEQDLKPVLDYEVSNPDISFLSQFMDQNPNLLLYSAHSVADKSRLPKNKIWIAEPNTAPTYTNGYAGIQYTWTGRVTGIQRNVDMNIFSIDMLLNISNLDSKTTPEQSQKTEDPTVRIIQLQLNTLLKKGLAVDGIKGPLTTAAIKEFQRIMGLSQDGIWGPKTAAVEEIYSKPEDGVSYPHYEYATRYIQMRVGAKVDGIFGNETKVQVQNWQVKHGLRADGIVGSVTWSRFLDENV
nr:GH25 family lysozyme [Clostridium pasteurianum]